MEFHHSGYSCAAGNVFKAKVEDQGALEDFTIPDQDFTFGAVSYTENKDTKTWYSYDDQGRVTWMRTWYRGLFDEPKTVEYAYDFFGNVTKISYQAGYASDQFYHLYTYDADYRISQVYASSTNIDGDAPPETNLVATYEYYTHGPLKRVVFGDDLQGVDYVYTLQGWLKTINNPTGDDPGGDVNDAFAMQLDYYNGDYLNPEPSVPFDEQFNGNIASTNWKTMSQVAGVYNANQYHFTYDDRNQLRCT
ncbi:MAG: hypothetical protein ACI8RL_002232 [Cyclobacteriaceae bacterium]|jgi:hypothetical protein